MAATLVGRAAVLAEVELWSRTRLVALRHAETKLRVELLQLEPTEPGMLVVVDARQVRLGIGARPVLPVRHAPGAKAHERHVTIVEGHVLVRLVWMLGPSFTAKLVQSSRSNVMGACPEL